MTKKAAKEPCPRLQATREQLAKIRAAIESGEIATTMAKAFSEDEKKRTCQGIRNIMPLFSQGNNK